MFEMKASEKTTELNAYVTGLGATKRVVVWDTTMEHMTTPQTLFVFGHEMGHYVLHHIAKGLTLLLLELLALFYLGYRLANWMVARYGARWGLRDLSDWASLPLLVLIISVLMFLATPAFNAVSRHYEHQADQYGLEVIHGLVPDAPLAAAEAFQILGERSLDYPYVGKLAEVLGLGPPNHPGPHDLRADLRSLGRRPATRIREGRTVNPCTSYNSPGIQSLAFRPTHHSQISKEIRMSASIPENFLDLFQKPAFGSFTTLQADGSPHTTPVWVDFQNGEIWVNSAVGRQKDRDVRHDPRVAIAVIDPDNPYRYLGIRGRVHEITAGWRDPAHRQDGKEIPGEGQVSVRPTRRKARALQDHARARAHHGINNFRDFVSERASGPLFSLGLDRSCARLPSVLAHEAVRAMAAS